MIQKDDESKNNVKRDLHRHMTVTNFIKIYISNVPYTFINMKLRPCLDLTLHIYITKVLRKVYRVDKF